MKNLPTFIILITCCLSSFAQNRQSDNMLDPIYATQALETDTTYSFKIVDGEVIWQYVFETDKTASEITNYFQKAMVFNISNVDSTALYGNVERQNINYEKLGFRRMNVALYINNPISYSVVVNIKDKRYRVTIFKVVFASNTNISLYGVSTNSNTQYTLTEMSYNSRRMKFKDVFFSQSAAQPLAAFWYNMFSVTSQSNSVTSDDW